MPVVKKAMLGCVGTSLLPACVSTAEAQTLTGLNLFTANLAGTCPLNAYADTGGGNTTNEILYGLA